jgi:hypothetical protein
VSKRPSGNYHGGGTSVSARDLSWFSKGSTPPKARPVRREDRASLQFWNAAKAAYAHQGATIIARGVQRVKKVK